MKYQVSELTGEHFRRMLEEGFAETRTWNEAPPYSRLMFLGDFIFNFTTYDDEASALFASKALEVCAAINDRKTFEYITDSENYRWYLWLCNTPFFANRLDWGTSIRGAWWNFGDTEYTSCGLWLDGQQECGTLKFTSDQWRAFIAAMLEFGKVGDQIEL